LPVPPHHARQWREWETCQGQGRRPRHHRDGSCAKHHPLLLSSEDCSTVPGDLGARGGYPPSPVGLGGKSFLIKKCSRGGCLISLLENGHFFIKTPPVLIADCTVGTGMHTYRYQISVYKCNEKSGYNFSTIVPVPSLPPSQQHWVQSSSRSLFAHRAGAKQTGSLRR